MAATPQPPIVLSYLDLRKAIGFIGLGLPFVLGFGEFLLQSRGIQDSISSYYYTDMGNVFVGSLCAIGVFLMSYKGYERRDAIAGLCAGIFAVGVALFPTTPSEGATSQDRIIGAIHLSFAALLFLTLAYFSIALFTEGVPAPTPQKLQRNKVYRFCGYAILVCIAVIAVGAVPSVEAYIQWSTLRFWFESIAIVAFGISWIVKGEFILADR